jgi:arylsulfatase A-like enzyme
MDFRGYEAMIDHPNVLIYVMDSLRLDRLGCYGYQKAHTPNLDALAKEAVLFENAYAQATWTRPSAVSILSSLYPSAAGIRSIHDVIPSEIPWLPTVFQRVGYKAACFSANPVISNPMGFIVGLIYL